MSCAEGRRRLCRDASAGVSTPKVLDDDSTTVLADVFLPSPRRTAREQVSEANANEHGRQRILPNDVTNVVDHVGGCIFLCSCVVSGVIRFGKPCRIAHRPQRLLWTAR